MRVLVTGANGFIGRNVSVQLGARSDITIIPFTRGDGLEQLRAAVAEADFVCHLAGVNRPDDGSEFDRVNAGLTRSLCDLMRDAGRPVPIILASSVHATGTTPYGASKLAAEREVLRYSEETGARVHIFRLPHVIGKWAKPNYNSVVATFCHNIARDLPIQVNDPASRLNVVHVDDLVDDFAAIIADPAKCGPYCEATTTYSTTLEQVVSLLRSFRESRSTLLTERVGSGFDRVLYATYMSYVPPSDFSYRITAHRDARGSFAEMLKTRDSGQLSFFTAGPGVTRGGHFHHSKCEKFLVVKGAAKFRFRNILTGERHELDTSADAPEIVETVPGWAHDITNVSSGELIVMLWGSEIFDPSRPDTFSSSLT